MTAELHQAFSEFSDPQGCAAARQFLFDHLPKTGGSTLRGVFEQLFGFENISPAISGRSERWARKRYSSYRMIIGHFHSPIPVELAKDHRARITVLRDPIDRAVSEYFYYRNNVERVPWHKLSNFAKDNDLYTYVRLMEEQRDAVVSNYYVRHFSRQISRNLIDRRTVLALASEALDRYDFVGIHEQFVDTVDLFCCQFGLPPVPHIPRYNVTSSRLSVGELDQATRNKLIGMNELDVAFYQAAAAKFQDRKRRIFRHYAGAGEPADSLASVEQKGIRRDALAASRPFTPDSFGNLAIELSGAKVVGAKSGTDVLSPGEETSIVLDIAAHIDTRDLTVGIEISDELGEIAFGTNTYLHRIVEDVVAGGRYEVSFTFPATLRHGRYLVGAALHTGASHEECCYHWRDRIATFDITDDAASGVGYCRLAPRIDWREVAAPESGDR